MSGASRGTIVLTVHVLLEALRRCVTGCLSLPVSFATPQVGVAEADGQQQGWAHVSWRCGARCSTEVNLRLAAEDGSTVRAAFLVPRARLSWRAGNVEVPAY